MRILGNGEFLDCPHRRRSAFRSSWVAFPLCGSLRRLRRIHRASPIAISSWRHIEALFRVETPSGRNACSARDSIRQPGVSFALARLHRRTLYGTSANGTDCAINATDITDNTTSFVNCEARRDGLGAMAAPYARRVAEGFVLLITIARGSRCEFGCACAYVHKDERTSPRSRSASRQSFGITR